jgi:heptosyltransferase-2/heptosyltransferase-3
VDTGPAHAAAALDCPLTVLFGKASPNRFRPVSRTSPVRILVGHADGNPESDPEIGYITPGQVLNEWQATIQSVS